MTNYLVLYVILFLELYYSDLMSGKLRVAMVLMESMASGHTFQAFRPRQSANKKEMLAYDPYVQQTVLYKEKSRIRTLKTRGEK